MQIDILLVVVSAIAALLGGAAALNPRIENLVRHFIGAKEPRLSYSEKLEALTSNLTKASKEVDAVLEEVAKVTTEREKAMKKAEEDLHALQTTEKELQTRIDQLKDVPLPVAEYFAELTSPTEKRSAKRDYLLFGSGVIVSTGIAIVLKLLGLG